MFLGPQYDLIWSAGALVAVALTLAAFLTSRGRRPVPVRVRSSDRQG
jgi:hypothetical protein